MLTPTRMVLSLVGALLLAACSPAGWSGPGLHQVDGVWLGTETPCDMGDVDVCAVDIQAAIDKFGDAASTSFVGGSTALAPVWRTADGRTMIRASSVTLDASLVVLDLGASGRHVVGLVCERATWDGDMITKPRTCWPSDDIVAPFRVGAPTPAP